MCIVFALIKSFSEGSVFRWSGQDWEFAEFSQPELISTGCTGTGAHGARVVEKWDGEADGEPSLSQ